MKLSLTVATTVVLTACQPGAHAPRITDGCYYPEGRRVLRAAKDHADILIPGSPRRVALSHPWIGNDITLTPGVLLDIGVDGAEITAVADDKARSYSAKPGAQPGFDLHAIASGEVEVRRGLDC